MKTKFENILVHVWRKAMVSQYFSQNIKGVLMNNFSTLRIITLIGNQTAGWPWEGEHKIKVNCVYYLHIADFFPPYCQIILSLTRL